MTNSDWDDDDFDGSDENLPKRLRAALKKASKQNDDLAAELTTLRNERKQANVAEVLKKAGVNPKVAKYLLSDMEDPTEESVTEWLTENADLFGVKPADAEGDEATKPKPAMSAEDVSAMNQLNQFVVPNQTPNPTAVAEAEEKLGKATTEQEIMAAARAGWGS